MPPPSLVSLPPTASISPRSRRTKFKAPTASHHYLLCSRRAAAPSPLHASPSYSSSPATSGGGGGSGGEEQFHLLEKPSATVPEEDAEAEAEPEPAPAPLSTEEALAPFLKFFQAKSTDPDADAASAWRRADSGAAVEGARRDGVSPGGRRVRYYDPKPGDLVAGVVVRSDGRTLDVDVGAGGEPALLLAKETVPVSEEEFGYLACDVASEHAAEFATEGRVGVMVRQVRGVEGDGEPTGERSGKGKGAPVMAVGTIVFAEVLGRTLSGRPLLSARRLFRRVAWHRVRLNS